MKATAPTLEKINPAFGTSIHISQFLESGQSKNKTPNWHVHPEVELVYVNGGNGKRHIGNQLSYYNGGDLILIGANLPHYGFTDRLTGNKSETIIQMKEDFLGEHFFDIPEMNSVKKLFEMAKMGIAFHGKTKRKVGGKIEKLMKYDPYTRLLKLLAIFRDLSESKEYSILNAQGFAIEIGPQDGDRINKVYHYVRNNFQQPIALEEISDQVSMTVPAFCRYFKKISGKTFTKFVNEYRLVHSIKLLSETPTNITDIAFESGFNNFSHFNKQFKLFTGKSPSKYREEQTRLVN